MKEYWSEFNKQTAFKVGKPSDAYFKEILNSSISITTKNPKLKAKLEIVKNFSQTDELRINLIVRSTIPNNLEALKTEMTHFEQKFKKFELRKNDKKSRMRLTATLEKISLAKIGEPKNLKIYPNQEKQFEWFDENLKKIKAALKV